jgi:hypothetical protein
MMPITLKPRGQLGPESTWLLRLLGLRLLAAQETLESLNPEEGVRDVNDALADVDDLFARVVGSWEVDGPAAQEFERVRDELSSHLVAVSAMAQAGISAVDVLREAIQTTRTEVEALLATPATITETT